jgi:hypothetical protein
MSQEERDKEIGRLAREHGERRREYLALSAKLKRIGEVLREVAEDLIQAGTGSYSEHSQNAKPQIESITADVNLSNLVELIDYHVRLTKQLIADQQILKEYGIER